MTQTKEISINTTNRPKSESLTPRIKSVIPGGVNSPFRSFHEVGGNAIFLESGKGSRVKDIDGNEYIDYVGSWGPAILGHAPEVVIEQVKKTLDKGFLFGAPHILEIELAEKIIDALPSIDNVRFVNSGTEAVMSSIRLARGYTGKDKVITFEGCYHGHSDPTLATNKKVHSSGIPSNQNKNTIEAKFNDLTSVNDCLEKNQGEVAAVILEPVTGSMGVIEPEPGFLAGLKSLCTKYDALLIFDEVLTGFRLAYGGAQRLYDIEPDLSCFGKLLGGGMPIGAYGGKAEIMQHLMPIGKVYQAGTFSGNPLTMAGGVAILKELESGNHYEILESRSQLMFDGLKDKIEGLERKHNKKADVQLQRVGSMFSILFAPKEVKDFKTSQAIDEEKFAIFFHSALNKGVYLPPTAQDAACVSVKHSESDIEETVEVFAESIEKALFGC